jgi:hypothetical protein
MKVTGFSFVKNAVKYQYPVVEAIKSVLPLCDDFIIAVGDSDDDTRALVAAIDSEKIKIIDSVWEENLDKGGRTFAIETDKAFQAITNETDWCFYIQADEVLHEQYYDEVMNQMKKWLENKEVEGLLFKYRHFYGSYDYIGLSGRWYRNEIRVIRNDKSIFSYRDAQSFRKGNNQKLQVKPIDAYIHHYGWVREPSTMFAKQTNFGRFYDGDGNKERVYLGKFDYSKIDALEKYTGTHPKVMHEKIAGINWQFEHDLSYNNLSIKDRFKNVLEKLTGKRPFDFNNYKII